MRFLTVLSIGAVVAFALPASASTYTYSGLPLTDFTGICASTSCAAPLTGSVTFNFDTSHFTGNLSLTNVTYATLNSPMPAGTLSYNLTYPSSTVWFNPPDNTYGFFEGISVGNFTFVNGAITSWLFGGGTYQVGCGGGPGCETGSSSTTTSTNSDYASYFTYDILGDSSGQNNGGGTWTLQAAVPEPSTWLMLLLGFAGMAAFGRISADARDNRGHAASRAELTLP